MKIKFIYMGNLEEVGFLSNEEGYLDIVLDWPFPCLPNAGDIIELEHFEEWKNICVKQGVKKQIVNDIEDESIYYACFIPSAGFVFERGMIKIFGDLQL